MKNKRLENIKNLIGNDADIEKLREKDESGLTDYPIDVWDE